MKSGSAATHAASEPRIAYFSMEIGLESDLPTYSGGLGVLAGDTLRAAADMCLPVVGVTLVHRAGYTRQKLDVEGNQHDEPFPWDPSEHLREVPERVQIEIAGRDVTVRAWRYDVTGVSGWRVPVYLMDTKLPENHGDDRCLTDRLYGGDARYRLAQETILGYGGVALLRALGHQRIHTFHMNEGHCALVPMALLEEKVGIEAVGTSDRRPDRSIRSLCVFTTHTPVAAGHDRFPAEVVKDILGPDRAKAVGNRFKGSFRQLNMTELALHFSRFTNGVAMRHAQVATAMFPGHKIHPITNGVHVGTWVAPPIAELYDRYVTEWREDSLNLRSAIAIPTDAVLEATARAKAALLDEVERRARVRLDRGIFTIGFGRRATGYKRADLIFEEPERLLAIAGAHDGLQIVFAGKAHPHDEVGKRLIRRIVAMGRELKPEVSVVYLENYDMALGRLLTSGVDVWLNNPEKPMEASGTSGMKAALNGVPNLSVLDGWWIEGHVEGVTGWSIGESEEDPTDRSAEATSLYDKLDKIVLPLYRRDPQSYGAIRRQAMALNGPHFSAQRMMLEYVERAYGGYRRMGVRAPSGAARATHG